MIYLVVLMHSKCLDYYANEFKYQDEPAILGAFRNEDEAIEIAKLHGGKVLPIETDVVIEDKSETCCENDSGCIYDFNHFSEEKCEKCKHSVFYGNNSGINLVDFLDD